MYLDAGKLIRPTLFLPNQPGFLDVPHKDENHAALDVFSISAKASRRRTNWSVWHLKKTFSDSAHTLALRGFSKPTSRAGFLKSSDVDL